MKYSKQRNLILEIVKSTHTHPSAEWVYEQARMVMPSIGIATVYRNLNVLAEMGEIRRISGLDNADRFDGNTGSHYHLKCRRCGRLLDLEERRPAASAELENLTEKLFSVEASEVCVSTALLEGLCADCTE